MSYLLIKHDLSAGGITTYVSNNGLILPLTAQALMGTG